jgi:type II secretory pathway component PulC
MQQEQTIKEKGSVPVSLPVSKPGPREEEIFPLKDGILTIQAISWAKNPSDRIAVINTKIVGEGESVQGYRILEIAQDEVIFELSGRKFRLPFTYR